MEKVKCPNCKSSKIKYKHSHPLNYHCKNCNLIFYDSRLDGAEPDSEKKHVSEFAISLAVLIFSTVIIKLLLIYFGK